MVCPSTLASTPVPEAGLPRSGKNIWKMKFFPGPGKSGNFVNGQGNLERTWKVRETSGNLKKNGNGRQSSKNLFCSRGETLYFLRDSLSPSPSLLGATLKGKNLLPKRKEFASLGSKFFGEQILSFKSSP